MVRWSPFHTGYICMGKIIKPHFGRKLKSRVKKVKQEPVEQGDAPRIGWDIDNAIKCLPNSA